MLLFFFEQHQLESALLGLGQFQNNFDELQAWLSHTTDLLQASRPISIDLQTCEIELAKHKVHILSIYLDTETDLLTCFLMWQLLF